MLLEPGHVGPVGAVVEFAGVISLAPHIDELYVDTPDCKDDSK